MHTYIVEGSENLTPLPHEIWARIDHDALEIEVLGINERGGIGLTMDEKEHLRLVGGQVTKKLLEQTPTIE